jgi:hypothetical protein
MACRSTNVCDAGEVHPCRLGGGSQIEVSSGIRNRDHPLLTTLLDAPTTDTLRSCYLYAWSLLWDGYWKSSLIIQMEAQK